MHVLLKFSLVALTSSYLSAVSAAPSQKEPTVPFSLGPKKVDCSFKKLPPNTVVVAAGAYQGRDTGFQIDDSGHESTQFDIGVHSNKPVALILSAYEPSIWSIGWTKGTRIVAVFVTGYHRQVVAGLPKNVPVRISTYDNKGTCGYFSSSGRDMSWANPQSQFLFSKDVTRVYNKHEDGVILIEEGPKMKAKAAFITSPEVKPESFKDPSAPLAGIAGLEKAVELGQLRVLTSEDTEYLQKVYLESAQAIPKNSQDVPPIAGEDEIHFEDFSYLTTGTPSYVVLKPFQFPAGLTGANLRQFLVPKGAPRPTGNPGHSHVIDLNDSDPFKLRSPR